MLHPQSSLRTTPTLKVVRSNRIGRTKRKALYRNGYRALSLFIETHGRGR